MNSPYEDIIHLPCHVSKTRPQMSLLDRAAQFSPFAALTGYDAAIREAGRLTEEKVQLDDGALTALDQKIQILTQHSAACPRVTVTYFQKDAKKSGGAYNKIIGRVTKIDTYKRTLVLQKKTEISLDDILDLDAEIFPIAYE